MSFYLSFFAVLLLFAGATAPQTDKKKEAPVLFTPSKYRILRGHLPPGPAGVQAAVSHGRYLVNFGTREGVMRGSIFQVFHQNILTGLVQVDQVWRDTAHVQLVNLVHKIDPESIYPLERGYYLKPKLVFLETIYFDEGQPGLSPEMHERLRYAARFIRAFPENPAILEGHTDNTGKEEDNIKLSRQRAAEIRTYLYEVQRIPLEQMHLKGYGSAEPIATNTTAEGRRLNRRVEITLVDTAPEKKSEKKSEKKK